MTKKPSSRAGSGGSAKRAVSLIARTASAAVARNRRLGEDALRLIARKSEQIAEAFYEIAVALQVLARKEVYAALGSASFDALVTERTSLSRALAYELLRLPQHYSREAAVALGREKAVALVRYVDATPAADAAETLARDDSPIAGTPVSGLSARAIEEAARKARPRAKKTSAAEEQALSAAHALEARIEKAAKKGGVRAMAVRKKGGWWVRVEVPAAIASRLDLGRAK